MVFGLGPTGFGIKRLTDVLADLKAAAAAQFGAGVNTSSDGALGKALGIFAEPVAELWALAQAVWSSLSPSTAEGVALDSIVELNNVVRLAPDETTFWARLDGTDTTVVPAGSTVQHPEALDSYATDADATIDSGAALRLDVLVSATGVGNWIVTIDGTAYTFVAGAVTPQQIVDGLAAVINRTPADLPILGGAVNQITRTFTLAAAAGNVTAEFPVGLGMRVFGSTGNDGIYTVVSRTFSGTQTSIVVAEDIPDATVDGNVAKGLTASSTGVPDADDPDAGSLAANTLRILVHFPATADDASLYALAAVLGAAPGAGAWALASVGSAALVRASETGPKAVNASVEFSILSGVAGWAGVWSVLAGDTGRDLESDADLRIRRLASLQQGGSTVDAIRAALLALDGVDVVFVYENDTDVAIGSRPPHSTEAVVEGGLPADIGQTIFDQKAAGIAAYGTRSVNVTDSMGVVHGIGYSRVTLVPMLAVVHVRTLYTEETLPDTAADLLAAALAAWGNAHTIGQDVIAGRSWGALYAAVPGLGVLDVLIAPTSGVARALDESDAVNDYLYLENGVGDVTAIFVPGVRFVVSGNTAGLNGCYTVQSSAFVAGRTRITVDQDVVTTVGAGANGSTFLAYDTNAIGDTSRSTFDAVSVLAVLPP